MRWVALGVLMSLPGIAVSAVGASAQDADASSPDAEPVGNESPTREEGGGEDPELEFGATAIVAAPPAPESAGYPELRDAPGTFGDPFRVVEALPGTVPIYTGIPYVYARGAAPAGNIYVWDDIPLPQLFHVALGPAVIHPRLVGSTTFYPGVAPARYGRHVGALLQADAPDPADAAEGWAGEVDLRLLDVNALVEAPVGDGGRLTLAGRYGYPGLVLSVLNPDVTLGYSDYQGRLDLPVSARDRLQLVWLGSYDRIETPAASSGAALDLPFGQIDSVLQFHRFEARLLHRVGRGELGSALRFGVDESSLAGDIGVTAFTLGPRAWYAWRSGEGTRLRVGADLIGATGRIEDPPHEGGGPVVDLPAGARGAVARSTSGAYGELSFLPSSGTRLDLGLRTDLWIVSQRVEVGVDPRVRLTGFLGDDLDLHGALGLAHQPAVFLLPLPGLSDVAVDAGLQRAIQAEGGLTWRIPEGVEVQGQLFVHHYTDALLPDLVDDGDLEREPERAEVLSWGAELLVARADAPARRLSGWLSYTLSSTVVTTPDGESFRPSFDVRHVLNLVGRATVFDGLSLGGRVHLHSGVPVNQGIGERPDRYAQRLEPFVRLDVRLGYRWFPSWGAVEIYGEWLNATMAAEPLEARCIFGHCTRADGPVISLPNVGVRAAF